MSFDGLINAEIKNYMTSPSQLKNWKSTPMLGSQGTISNQQALKKLDAILSNTTIKRACCLGSEDPENPDYFKVDVRIPIPANFDSSDDRNIEYGFIDKSIKIPKSYCDNVESSDGSVHKYKKPDKRDAVYSKRCDDFFNVYCPNMLHLFNSDTQSGDKTEFSNFYKKECACYNIINPLPPGTNLSTRCLNFPQCNDSNADLGITYLDLESRKSCPNSVTICTQALNLQDAGAGGDINVKTFMQNNCGGKGEGKDNVDDSAGIIDDTQEETQEDKQKIDQTGNNDGNSGNKVEQSATISTSLIYTAIIIIVVILIIFSIVAGFLYSS